MPKYRFVCVTCNTEVVKTTSLETKSITCETCSDTMNRAMPKLNGPSDKTEVVNKYMGKISKSDQKEIVKSRKDEYYWTIEVPRLVSSGVYSLETMLDNGWVYFNDKEQMIINDKPPHRR